LPFAKVTGTAIEKSWNLLAGLLHQRTEKLSEIPEKIAFLLEQPEYTVEMFNNKKSKCNPEIALDILQEMRPVLAQLPENPDPEAVSALLSACAERREVKLGLVMWAVRIAMSGTPVTPGGPGEIMEIIGREESFARLNSALAKIG
jgi:glutamyl-tRNA synthetase